MAFVPCEAVTGDALTEQILQCLDDWNLQVGDVRGQGYDGAGNMSGKFKGVQGRISNLNKKALYFHCASHNLSLCVLKSCQVSAVKNMVATMTDLAYFFNYAPQKQRHFDRVLESAAVPSRKHKIVDLCKTRWVERHTAFETFADLYQVLHDCLGQVSSNNAGWDTDTVTRATGFLHCMPTCGGLCCD